MDPEKRIEEALGRWNEGLKELKQEVKSNTVSVAKLATTVGMLKYIILSVFLAFVLGIGGLFLKLVAEAEPQEPPSAIVHTR